MSKDSIAFHWPNKWLNSQTNNDVLGRTTLRMGLFFPVKNYMILHFVIHLPNLSTLSCESSLPHLNENNFPSVKFNTVSENHKIIGVTCFNFLL